MQATHDSVYRSPIVRQEEGTQPHRRSPEKRFHSPGPICRICHEGAPVLLKTMHAKFCDVLPHQLLNNFLFCDR